MWSKWTLFEQLGRKDCFKGAFYGNILSGNSLIPIITLFAGLFPSYDFGSVIIEEIFSIPGMGRIALSHKRARLPNCSHRTYDLFYAYHYWNPCSRYYLCLS